LIVIVIPGCAFFTRRPGISNFWIPGSLALLAPRNDIARNTKAPDRSGAFACSGPLRPPEEVYRPPMNTIESFGFGENRATNSHIRLLALLLLTRRQAPFPKTMLKLDASRNGARARFRASIGKMRHMMIGTVKWFNGQKGFGFIAPQDGGNDVFVHISAVERAGLSNLAEGQKIEFEAKTDKMRGKTSAENLQLL
jgi:CspA family cold shock protein